MIVKKEVDYSYPMQTYTPLPKEKAEQIIIREIYCFQVVMAFYP